MATNWAPTQSLVLAGTVRLYPGIPLRSVCVDFSEISEQKQMNLGERSEWLRVKQQGLDD